MLWRAGGGDQSEGQDNKGREGELRKSLKDLKPGRGVWFSFWKDPLPVVWGRQGRVATWKWANQVQGKSRSGMRKDSGATLWK